MRRMSRSVDFLKRIFREVISIVFMSSFVVGCTPLHLPPTTPTITVTHSPTASQSTLPTQTPSPTSAIQLNEEQLQGITIRFWHPYLGNFGETYDRLAAEFSRQNRWKIQVESEGINGVDSLNEKMGIALEQSELPHLVIAPLYQALRWNQIKPTLVDWSPYLDDVQWGLPSTDKEKFYPNLWQASSGQAPLWGIPARRVAQLLLYNASWARELGMNAAPRTFREFQQQTCAVQASRAQTDDSPKVGYLFTHDYPTVLGWFTAFGAQIALSEEKGYQFESPEVEEALIYLRRLIEQGCASTMNEEMDAIDAFSRRQALIVPLNSGQIRTVERAMEVAANSDRWTVLPFPTATGDGSTILYGTDFVLLRATEQEQLAAWLFVKWMFSRENQELLAGETLGLPLRSDVVEELQNDPRLPLAYQEVLDLLPMGVNEPLWLSWDTVRWAVGDASRQLVAWYFTLEQVPSLMQLLDKTAAQLQPRKP